MLESPAIGQSLYRTRLLQETLTNSRGVDVGWLFVLPRFDESGHRLAEVLLPLFIIGASFSFMLYSFMLPWWVYLDARTRTTKAVPLALFVFLTNFFGWLTYLVIRPESDRLCPGCDSHLDPGFRLCPVCGWSATLRCHQCGRPARADWRYCPYCETARPDVDLSAGLHRDPTEPGKSWH
jgi:Double zinc ribbon